MKTQIRMRMIMAVLTLALLGGVEARAQSRFNKTSGEWTNAANWSPSGTPTAATDCQVCTSSVVDATATIASGQDCLSKYLRLGNAAGQRGTVNMSGGTLTGASTLSVGYSASSTGIINQTGGTVANYTTPILGVSGNGSWNMSGSATATNLSGSFYMGTNAGSVGKLLLQGSAVWSNSFSTYLRVGSDQFGTSGGDGTVEVNGGTFWISKTGGANPLQLGGAGGIGRLVLTGGSATVGSDGLSLGYSATGTGVLSVAGGTYNGAITIGAAGQGYVYATNNGTLSAASVTMGSGAGSNAYMLVDHNATFSSSYLRVGNAAGNVSVVDLKGGTTTIDTGSGQDGLAIGFTGGSTGIVNITGGTHAWSASAARSLGRFAGSLGRLTIAGGSLSSPALVVGNEGSGELNIESGSYTNSAGLTLGNAAGSVGRMRVTGGLWMQSGALNVGSVAAGVTGVVTVANCVSTNITGAVTVGGGTAGGDRYGSVTISNATFGGSTAVSVWTNGFVELTGTGSVFVCNTFTCRGGTVTNYVQGMAGGVDVTNSALLSLVITNGARMHLVFQKPSSLGAYWGLRWAGNRATQLQGMTNSGALSWDASQAGGVVEIFTNATHTMVGYVVDQAGTTFRFR
jgi:T5SS/PEP-CTERM-associated repeat protein